MNNVVRIDNYVNSLVSVNSLRNAKALFIELKKELVDNGHYIDRPRCNYSLNELEYAIKSINLKIRLLYN